MKAPIATFVSLAALSCALTLLFLGMRSVMEIGGACADGGPYVSAQPCPDGVPLMMLAGIWGGIIAAGFLAYWGSKLGPGYGTIAMWAWPALFLSLGWNVLEYGVDPPGDAGVEGGWLFCGVLFVLMGGFPLLGMLRPSELRSTFWPEHGPAAEDDRTRPSIRDLVPVGATLRRAAPGARHAVAASGPVAARPAPTPASDVASQLERLARLHHRGDLDDTEYEAAKRAVLGD